MDTTSSFSVSFFILSLVSSNCFFCFLIVSSLIWCCNFNCSFYCYNFNCSFSCYNFNCSFSCWGFYGWTICCWFSKSYFWFSESYCSIFLLYSPSSRIFSSRCVIFCWCSVMDCNNFSEATYISLIFSSSLVFFSSSLSPLIFNSSINILY